MIATRSTYAPDNTQRRASWEPIYRAFRNRFAGLDHSGTPLPSRPSPAPITSNARLGGQEIHGPLSEGEQYAKDACEDGRAYVFDGRGFLVD